VFKPHGGSRGSWLILALTGAGFAIVAALFASWTARKAGGDDVFITYVYARSFATGHGLTWPGSSALGTSSPFLALVLGSLSALTGFEVPQLGNAVSWFAIAAASTGLFALGRAEGWPWAGWAAGLLWLVAAPSHLLLGNEILPAIAAVIWAFHERARGRLASAGALLALAAMFRAETGLAAPILGSLELSRADLPGSFRRIARIARVSILVAGVWLGALYALTGHVVPATFAAKRAQAESTLGLWPRTRGWIQAVTTPDLVFPARRRSWWWPLALAAGVAVGVGVRRRRREVVASLAPQRLAAAGGARRREEANETTTDSCAPLPVSALALIAWGAGHLVLVLALGVSFYGWYAAPLRFAQLLLPTLALAAIDLPRLWLRRGWMIASGAALAAVALATRSDLHLLRTISGDQRRPAYARVAALAERYPPGTRIAAWEVGFLGWHSARPVVDLLGLVSDRASLDAVRHADLRQNLDRLRGDLLMTTLDANALWKATTAEPRRFLADFRLDQLMLSPAPPIAVYRRARMAPRGEVAIDLLASIAASDPAANLGWHRTAGIGLLSLALARGEQMQIRLAPGPRRALLAQLTTVWRKGRIQVRVETGGIVGGSIEKLEADGWTRFATMVPESETGATLTFSCLRGKGCLIGQPYLSQPYLDPPDEPAPQRPRRHPQGKGEWPAKRVWRP
jgi:hypothetical protein